MKTRELEPFGVEIHSSEIDVLTSVDKIIDLMRTHKLIVIKEFESNADQLVEILNQFGNPIRHARWQENALKTHPEIYVLTNDKSKGQLSPPIWHIDQSYLQCPPTFSFLWCLKHARVGGQTVFADQEMAYKDLDQETKQLVNGKVCEHEHARGYTFAEEPTSEELKNAGVVENVYHPLAMPSWLTNRTCLYSVHGHIKRILGMEDQDSKDLLSSIQEHSVRDKYCYTHQWAEKDFLIWDNISMLHTAKDTADSLHPDYERMLWRMNCRYKNI